MIIDNEWFSMKNKYIIHYTKYVILSVEAQTFKALQDQVQDSTGTHGKTQQRGLGSQPNRILTSSRSGTTSSKSPHGVAQHGWKRIGESHQKHGKLLRAEPQIPGMRYVENQTGPRPCLYRWHVGQGGQERVPEKSEAWSTASIQGNTMAGTMPQCRWEQDAPMKCAMTTWPPWSATSPNSDPHRRSKPCDMRNCYSPRRSTTKTSPKSRSTC